MLVLLYYKVLLLVLKMSKKLRSQKDYKQNKMLFGNLCYVVYDKLFYFVKK